MKKEKSGFNVTNLASTQNFSLDFTEMRYIIPDIDIISLNIYKEIRYKGTENTGITYCVNLPL